MIGLPVSICCQCLAEKPKEIISSWLNPRAFRISRTLPPSREKNLA